MRGGLSANSLSSNELQDNIHPTHAAHVRTTPSTFQQRSTCSTYVVRYGKPTSLWPQNAIPVFVEWATTSFRRLRRLWEPALRHTCVSCCSLRGLVHSWPGKMGATV